MNLLHRKYVARIADTGSVHKPDKKLHAALPDLSLCSRIRRKGFAYSFSGFALINYYQIMAGRFWERMKRSITKL